MKTIVLLLMCAVFAGCSSVNHTNSTTTGATASASQARPQYHAHIVTDYSSEGGTKFLEMDTNDDAGIP